MAQDIANDPAIKPHIRTTVTTQDLDDVRALARYALAVRRFDLWANAGQSGSAFWATDSKLAWSEVADIPNDRLERLAGETRNAGDA